MHTIEPYYNWRNQYIASEDENSPFYHREYSEFEFSNTIYNHYIHPQWDDIGSPTLYLKIIFTDYLKKYCIIELMGEWNDAIHNDVMFLKRHAIDHLNKYDINKYILIGENILNFHSSDDSYYQEWFEDIEDGWITGLNFREHVIHEFQSANIDYYIAFGGILDCLDWRIYQPDQLYKKVDGLVMKRLEV